MSIAFAGGSGAFTVCSHLGGSGGGCCQFMQYLDRWDCASLRLVCKELYDMTKEYEVYVAAMAMRPSNYASKRTLSQHNTRPESLGPLAWPLGRLQGRTTRVIDNPSALAGIVRWDREGIAAAVHHILSVEAPFHYFAAHGAHRSHGARSRDVALTVGIRNSGHRSEERVRGLQCGRRTFEEFLNLEELVIGHGERGECVRDG